MKVCVVTTAFPSYLGDGDGVFVWESAAALVRAGVQVCVVAMHRPGWATREVMEGVEIFRPRYWRPERFEMLRKELGGLPIVWRKYPLARAQLLPFMLVHTLTTLRCARDCDLVHAHWTLSAAAAVLARPLHRRPVVATVQGSDIFRGTQLPLGKLFTHGVLKRCAAVTALSEALAVATSEVGIPREKIHIIPNGVVTERFKPLLTSEREKLIVYVGSFIERKGVKYLLQAVANAFPNLSGYQLVLIGDGPEKAYLQDLAQQLGIAERVRFLGFLPQDQVRHWLQRAKLFVLPSLEEGLGVVLLEALACGTPIVASGVGGIVDVVTAEVGQLVPPADSDSLGRTIVQVLLGAAWDQMSQDARQRAVTVYDWDHVGSQYLSVYRTLLSQSIEKRL